VDAGRLMAGFRGEVEILSQIPGGVHRSPGHDDHLFLLNATRPRSVPFLVEERRVSLR